MRMSEVPTEIDGSHPGRGPPPTIPGTALLFALLLGVLVVASYPIASGLAVAAALVLCRLRRILVERLRTLTTETELGPLCIPGTDVCLGQ